MDTMKQNQARNKIRWVKMYAALPLAGIVTAVSRKLKNRLSKQPQHHNLKFSPMNKKTEPKSFEQAALFVRN